MVLLIFFKTTYFAWRTKNLNGFSKVSFGVSLDGCLRYSKNLIHPEIPQRLALHINAILYIENKLAVFSKVGKSGRDPFWPLTQLSCCRPLVTAVILPININISSGRLHKSSRFHSQGRDGAKE